MAIIKAMQKKDFYTSNLWKNGVKFFSELNQFIEKFPSSERGVLGIQIKSSMVTILADLAEVNECENYNLKKKIISTAKGRIERIKCYLRISIESGSVDKVEAEKIVKKFDNMKREINGLLRLRVPRKNVSEEKEQNKYLREILKFIKNKRDGASFIEIREWLAKNKLDIHERTLRRFISVLYNGNCLSKKGVGRSVFYEVID